MARPDAAEILADCVADIQAGRRSLADCLAAHPDLRGELEPLLVLALSITPLPAPKPDPTRKMLARHRFIEALHRERRRPRMWPPSAWLAPVSLLARRAAWLAIAAALALIMSASGGVALASQDAQPGDPLYGVKTALEQAQLAATLSDDAKAEVHLRIAERRLQELSNALAADDERAVALAAEAHEVAVSELQRHLAKVKAQGRDVSQALSQLEATRERREEALRLARAKGAGPAYPARERERERDQERAGPDSQGGATQVQPAGDIPGGRKRDPEGPGDKVGDAGDQNTARAKPRDDGGASGAAEAPSDGAQATGEPGKAIDDLIAKTEDVAVSSQVSGESLRGLLAKLKAAEAALDRGQHETALNQLLAFHNQLQAMYQAGRIDDGSYRALLDDYGKLMASLDSRVGPSDESRGRGQAERSATPGATSDTGASPAVGVATPAPRRGDAGPGSTGEPGPPKRGSGQP